MYPVWLWSLLQVALSQPSILARSWWEAAPSEDGRAQTETVSAPRQSARHATSDMPTTTSPKQILRGVSLLILHLVWFNSCLHHFFFFFFTLKRNWWCMARMQAGREGVFCCWGSKMIRASPPRLWCFLAGFRQQLTIWWSGSAGLFKSPAHPGPSRLALQWQTL